MSVYNQNTIVSTQERKNYCISLVHIITLEISAVFAYSVSCVEHYALFSVLVQCSIVIHTLH